MVLLRFGDHCLCVPAQPQDSILRLLNPCAYDYMGLSKRKTDYRVERENWPYVQQLRVFRNVTDFGQYVDEPDGVSASRCRTTT